MPSAPLPNLRTTWNGMIASHHEWEAGHERTDVCPRSHWGYVMSGSILMRYENGSEETIAAGNAFYMLPRHTARTDEGVAFLLFTPED